MVERFSDEDFESLLVKYDYRFKRGDIVKGVDLFSCLGLENSSMWQKQGFFFFF